MYKSLCLLVVCLTTLALVNAQSQAESFSVDGVIFDQLPKLNNNFQPSKGCSAYTRGIVKATLGANRLPELNSLDPDNSINYKGGIVNPALFQYFFAPNSSLDIAIPYKFVMTNDGSGVYTFDSQTFFPINNQGFDTDPANRVYKDNRGKYQNFHFCMVSHMLFTYQGIEEFNFRGDDDVWVFINNKLAVDIGGIHAAETGSIDLVANAANFGLEVKKTYPLDFFYCERCMETSTIKIQTSIQVFCATYDYCGVCNGDGSTCCTPSVHCNDNDACTDDACPKPGTGVTADNWKTKCTHTPKTCKQTDSCFANGCVAGSCVVTNTPLGCASQSCKSSKCVAGTGCQYAELCPNPDKCSTRKCTAGNGIVADSCTSPVAVNCDKGDKCMVYGCNGTTGCTASPKNCVNGTDTNVCHQYYCDATTGNCLFKTIPDSECGCCQGKTINKCQVGTCTNGQCIITDNPLINDNDPCTSDTCNLSTGAITHTRKACAGCTNCDSNNDGVCATVDTSCDDSNKCTVDKCATNGTCSYTPTDCDDGNPCTDDLCDAVRGCYHVDTVCPNVGECQVGICSKEAGGCTTQARVCPTDSFCTDSICIEGAGCANFTRNCVGDDPKCQKGTCNEETQECEFHDFSPKPFGCNKAAIISTGVIAGVVVAGAVALAIAAFGGKKGYDYWKSHNEHKISNLNTNPLYTANPNSGHNPLFQEAGN